MNKSVLENKSNPIKLWCQQDIGGNHWIVRYHNLEGLVDF